MRGWFEVLGVVAVLGAGFSVVNRFRQAGRLGLVVLAVAVVLFLLAAAAAVVVPYLV